MLYLYNRFFLLMISSDWFGLLTLCYQALEPPREEAMTTAIKLLYEVWFFLLKSEPQCILTIECMNNCLKLFFLYSFLAFLHTNTITFILVLQ